MDATLNGRLGSYCRTAAYAVVFAVAVGAGATRLTRLVRLPIDALKLDAGLVARMSTERGVRAVVGGVVATAEELGIEVAATGVETPEQVRTLVRWGCRLGQGPLWTAGASAADLLVEASVPGRGKPPPCEADRGSPVRGSVP